MCFPSSDIQDWCQSWEGISTDCQCGALEYLAVHEPREERGRAASALLWAVWIDRALHRVLPRDQYAEFHDTYPFPVFRSLHLPGFQVNPDLAVPDPDWTLATPGNSLYQPQAWWTENNPCPSREDTDLFGQKILFWGEIRAWLSLEGWPRHAIRAEAEMKKCVRRHHQEHLCLFDPDDDSLDPTTAEDPSPNTDWPKLREYVVEVERDEPGGAEPGPYVLINLQAWPTVQNRAVLLGHGDPWEPWPEGTPFVRLRVTHPDPPRLVEYLNGEAGDRYFLIPIVSRTARRMAVDELLAMPVPVLCDDVPTVLG